MATEADFIRAVCERPDDDTPRLVFADWLDERGDREGQERAAFIRLHVAYAREERKTYRAKMERQIRRSLAGAVTVRAYPWVSQILDGYGMGLSIDGWGYTVVPVNHHARVRRGFVEEITTSPAWFAANGAATATAHPIRLLTLLGAGVRLEIDPPGEDYGWQIYEYRGTDVHDDFIGDMDTREEMVERLVEYTHELPVW